MSLAENLAKLRYHEAQMLHYVRAIAEDASEFVALAGRQAPEIDRIVAIQEIVAAHYRLPVADITGKGREGRVVVARHCAMLIAHRLTRSSDADLGRAFVRTHGAVAHAIQSIEGRLETEGGFAREFAELEELCRRALGVKAA